MYEENLFAVDTTGIDKMGGFEIYPAGLYPAIMISASKKPTRDNNGAFIECVYQFVDGDVNGKKFTSRMNLWNSNTQAVDIAKRELKSIRIALGLNDHASNLADFVNKPLVLNISVKARKDDAQKMENNLVSIEPYSGAPAQAAPAYQPQPQPPQWVQPQVMPGVAQPPNWQPPQQQAPQTFQQPAGQIAPAFQPNTSAPPPWAANAR